MLVICGNIQIINDFVFKTKLICYFRTNKACPLYQNSGSSAPLNVAMTEEQEEEIERQLNTDDEDLVNVDGTKVKLSGKLLKVSSFKAKEACYKQLFCTSTQKK